MDVVEDVLQKSKFDWPEAKKQQADEDLNEILEQTAKLISKANATARSFRRLADKLDVVWKDCKTAHAIGDGVSIVGGLLTLGGGVATFLTAGAAAPLLVLGMAVGGAGAVTSIAAGRIKNSIDLKEVERAQMDLKQTLECLNIVNDTILKWQDGKDVGRLLCIFSLALQTLTKNHPVIKILRKVISNSWKITTDFLKKFMAMGKAASKLVGKATVGAAVEVADDLTSTALNIGGQAADDVVGAGVKAGATASKVAGGVIIAASVALLVWDAVDLYFTVQELIEKRGSEAAKDLRAKADELDKKCSFN